MIIKMNDKKYLWIFLFELFLLMPFQYIKIQSFVYDIIVLFRYLFIIIEIFILVAKNKIQIYYPELLLIMYVFYEFVLSFILSSTTITNNISSAILIILLLFSLKRNLQVNYDASIRTLSLFFFIAILFNFLSILIRPFGLYTTTNMWGDTVQNYFLGIDNSFGLYLLPGCSFVWYAEEYIEKRGVIIPIITLIMALYTYVFTMSASGLIAIFIFLILFIFYRFNIFKKIISIRLLLIITFIVSIGLVFGSSFIYHNDFFNEVVNNKLGKDITFSGRTPIWESGINQFLENPFWGYGKKYADSIVSLYGVDRLAHNFLLQIILEGGICGSCIFAFFIINIVNKSSLLENTCEPIKIIYIGIVSTLVYFQMESGNSIFTMTLLFLVLFYSVVNIKKYNNL